MNKVIYKIKMLSLLLAALLMGRLDCEAYAKTMSPSGVPIITTIQVPTDRPSQASEAEVWAQIEQDFTEAKADFWNKEEYTGNDIGRATKGGATAYLGKVYLQQKKIYRSSSFSIRNITFCRQ